MKTKIFFSAALVLTLITAAQAQTLPDYLPSDGLAGWYPFSGNANDESGNGNNGLINGSILSTDRFGNDNSAYTFDGVDDFIQLEYLFPSIAGSSSATYNCWALSIEASGGVLVSQWYQGATAGPVGLYYALTPQNRVAAGMIAGEGIITASETQSTQNWNMYTIVFNANAALSSDKVKIYQNGIPIQLQLYNAPFSVGNQSNIATIGARAINEGVGEFYKGQLDDIAIYNRALSQEEITALFTGEPVNAPSACNPLPSNLQNGLVGYWPFCGDANDESGNGNAGAVNGATLTEDRFGLANAAYDFDGIGDNVLIDNMPFCENYTFNCWLRCDTIFTPYPEIYNTSNADENNRLHLVGNIYPFNEQGKVFTGDDNNGNLATSTSKVNDNNWNMITVIYDYTNNDVKLLVNGEVEATETIINPSTFEGALMFGNGFSQQPNPQPYDSKGFVGHLDDIGIWNRALTAEEVQELYTLNACTFTVYDTVTVENYVTIYDTVSVSVSTTDTLIINTLITAVQPAQENTFLVYPNPAGSQITINNGNVGILGGYTMRISNSIGQEVYNQNITQTEVTLNLSTWGGNGLYVLYILDPQGEIIAVKQIVLQ